MNQTTTAWIDWSAYSSASPVAHQPKTNQDNYLIIDSSGQCQCLMNEQKHSWAHANWQAGHYRFVIMDGVGKNPLSRDITERVCQSLGAVAPFSQAQEMNDYLDRLHQSIVYEFTQNFGHNHGGGTTLTVVETLPNREAFIYHVGDSRLYALTDAGMELLTIDHCDGTQLAISETIEQKVWIDKVLYQPHNRISQAFGFGHVDAQGQFSQTLNNLQADVLPEFLAQLADRRTLTLPEHFCLILATDGLWCFERPQVFMDALAQELHSLNAATAQSHTERIKKQHEQFSAQEGYVDNTSVIVVQSM